MKATIDIPDALYRRAKIPAVETGRTLKDLVLSSLEKELEPPPSTSGGKPSYWADRKLVPEFKALWESASHSDGTDPTRIISEERDAR